METCRCPTEEIGPSSTTALTHAITVRMIVRAARADVSRGRLRKHTRGEKTFTKFSDVKPAGHKTR